MKALTDEQRDALQGYIAQQVENAVAFRTQQIVEAIAVNFPGFSCPGCGWPWEGEDEG